MKRSMYYGCTLYFQGRNTAIIKFRNSISWGAVIVVRTCVGPGLIQMFFVHTLMYRHAPPLTTQQRHTSQNTPNVSDSQSQLQQTNTHTHEQYTTQSAWKGEHILICQVKVHMTKKKKKDFKCNVMYIRNSTVTFRYWYHFVVFILNKQKNNSAFK